MSGIGFLLCDRSRVPTDDGWLSPAEREWLRGRRAPQRVEDWRLGRWTAKRAVPAYLRCAAGDPLEVEILAAEDGAPIARAGGRPLPLSLSLSHRVGVALCVVAEARFALGCDLERIEPRSPAFLRDYFTRAEQALLERVSDEERDRLANLVWSAKESALKAQRQGLRADTRSVEITASPERTSGWGALEARTADRSRTFHGHWRRIGDLVVTILSSPPCALIALAEWQHRERALQEPGPAGPFRRGAIAGGRREVVALEGWKRS